MNIWAYLRLGFVALSTWKGFHLGLDSFELESRASSWDCVLAIVGIPPFLVLFVAIQEYFGLLFRPWREPAWTNNPFSFRQPLDVWHMVGWGSIGAGIAACIGVLSRGAVPDPDAAMLLCMGIGLLLGVQLCHRVFRSRFVV